MQTLEEILEAARRLSDADRERLIEKLHDNEGEEPSEERRRAAMQRWLARVGTGHSDFTSPGSSSRPTPSCRTLHFPPPMRYPVGAVMFDFAKYLPQTGLTAEEVETLEREVRAEFPRDDMLYELHMLRALKKIIRDRNVQTASMEEVSR